MNKISFAISFVFILFVIFFSSCANRHLDIGHRVNYWNNRHPHDHKGDRYYYPNRNRENRPRYNSYRF